MSGSVSNMSFRKISTLVTLQIVFVSAILGLCFKGCSANGGSLKTTRLTVGECLKSRIAHLYAGEIVANQSVAEFIGTFCTELTIKNIERRVKDYNNTSEKKATGKQIIDYTKNYDEDEDEDEDDVNAQGNEINTLIQNCLIDLGKEDLFERYVRKTANALNKREEELEKLAINASPAANTEPKQHNQDLTLPSPKNSSSSSNSSKGKQVVQDSNTSSHRISDDYKHTTLEHGHNEPYNAPSHGSRSEFVLFREGFCRYDEPENPNEMLGCCVECVQSLFQTIQAKIKEAIENLTSDQKDLTDLDTSNFFLSQDYLLSYQSYGVGGIEDLTKIGENMLNSFNEIYQNFNILELSDEFTDFIHSNLSKSYVEYKNCLKWACAIKYTEDEIPFNTWLQEKANVSIKYDLFKELLNKPYNEDFNGSEKRV